MAGDAILRSLLEGRHLMTFLTGDNGMQTDEGKGSQIMIKLDLTAPVARVMASFTLLSLFPFVIIIGKMAGHTGNLQLFPSIRGLMAYITCQLPMLIHKRKLCLIMVINGLLPVLRRMAAVTFDAEHAPMLVIQFMTAFATYRQLLFRHRFGVTPHAGHLLMLSLQEKFCLIMVKLRILPQGRRVALFAFCSEPALMKVIILMASSTGNFLFLVVDSISVALPAGDTDMFVPQGKLCFIVIIENIFPGGFSLNLARFVLHEKLR